MSQPIRILFVDDEAEFVNYTKKRLERHELEVRGFTNPVEALAQTEGETFDVALLDLKMPEMDGEQLLNRLKARDPGIEVIILTGHGSIESAFRSAKEGAYEYLLKPCDFDQLVSAVNSAYAKRVKALSSAQEVKVNQLLEQAVGLSPLSLLKQLKQIHDGLETSMSAAAMAEEGATEAAREMMEGADGGTDGKGT